MIVDALHLYSAISLDVGSSTTMHARLQIFNCCARSLSSGGSGRPRCLHRWVPVAVAGAGAAPAPAASC